MTLQEARDFLGLKPGYTDDDVQRSYRRLALRHHPDRGGDVREFKKLTAAYGIVRDPRKAAAPYDPTIVTPFFRNPS